MKMNRKTAGWFMGLAGLAMILHLLSGDLKELDKYSDIITYPKVLSGILEHLGSTITAFIGGNVAPNLFNYLFNSDNRVSDSKLNELQNT